MEEIRKLLIVFGAKVDKGQVKGAEKTVEASVDRLKGFAKKLGVVFGAAAIFNFVKTTTKAAAEIGELSKSVGFTTDEFQEFEFVAESAGVATNKFRDGMGRFGRRIAEAAKGTGDAREAFKQLGVPLKDAQGKLRRTPDILADVADGLNGVTSETERLRLSSKIFSAEDASLGGAFAKSSEEIAILRRRFKELGGGFTADMIHKSEEATKAFTELRAIFKSLTSTLFVFLLPRLRDLLSAFVDVGGELAGNKKFIAGMKAGLVGLGAVLLVLAAQWVIGFLPAIAIGAVAAVAILAIGFALDELYTAFNGGQTVIGEFVDSLFGVGTTAGIVQALKDTWVISIDAMGAAMKRLSSELSLAKTILKTFFGITTLQFTLIAKPISLAVRLFQKFLSLVSKATGINVGGLVNTLGDAATGGAFTSITGGVGSSKGVQGQGRPTAKLSPSASAAAAGAGAGSGVAGAVVEGATIVIQGVTDPVAAGRIAVERAARATAAALRDAMDSVGRRAEE